MPCLPDLSMLMSSPCETVCSSTLTVSSAPLGNVEPVGRCEANCGRDMVSVTPEDSDVGTLIPRISWTACTKDCGRRSASNSYRPKDRPCHVLDRCMQVGHRQMGIVRTGQDLKSEVSRRLADGNSHTHQRRGDGSPAGCARP